MGLVHGTVNEEIKTSLELIKELEHDRPVIIGYNATTSPIGHAVVVVGLDYKVSIIDCKAHVSKVYILDPEPSDENKKNKGKKEFVGEFVGQFTNSYLMISFV